MAGSVNKVILIGRLGADPDIRSGQGGREIGSLRIATSETWRDKATGERKEKTEWHRVTLFSEPAVKFAKQYLKKGAQVYVEGSLQTRKWTDQGGIERYSTDVVVQGFNAQLTSLQSGGGGVPPATGEDDYGTTRTRDDGAGRVSAGGAPNRDMDDEIPF